MMTAGNLSRVFGPTLFPILPLNIATPLVEFMIEHQAEIFNVATQLKE
jgi:hypothetical protein